MIAFSLWQVHVYRYGIFYLITAIIGYWFLRWVWKQWRFKTSPGIQKLLTHGIDDLILYTICWVLIWGRLGHVFLYDRSYYADHLKEIFAIRHGWMSFVWGIVGVIFAIFLVEKKYNLSRKEFFIIFDLLLLIVPIGIVLGRIGNFLNQELYGIVVPETLQWLKSSMLTHVYPAVDRNLRINTNFIAAFFEWLCIWIVLVIQLFKQLAKQRKPWMISVTFIMLYSCVRFFLEFLRQDSQAEHIWPLTTTQRAMVIFLGFGFAVWFMYDTKDE